MGRKKTRPPGFREKHLSMVPAETEEVRTAVANQRGLRDKILKARLTWAMLGQDVQKTEQVLDLEPGLLERWKTTMAPDGKDWGHYASELGLDDAADMFEVVGPQDEFGFSGHIIRQAQRLMNTCVSVMNEGALYDEDGNKVEFLYDFSRRQVPIGGLRPRSFGEAAQGVRQLNTVVQENFERVRELTNWEERSKREREALATQVTIAVRRAFGEEGLERFMQIAAGVGLRDVGGEIEGEAEVVEEDDGPPVVGDTILF